MVLNATSVYHRTITMLRLTASSVTILVDVCNEILMVSLDFCVLIITECTW